jgi:hypothetical protein
MAQVRKSHTLNETSAGLADPRMPESELAKYVSKRRLNTLQTQHNPRSYTCLTEDKSIFYPFCTASGIPVPKLYAIFDPLVGWSSNGLESVILLRNCTT